MSLTTAKLEESERFYHALLGVEPSVRREGYLFFKAADPAFDLVLMAGGALVADNSTHFGIGRDSTSLEAALTRLRAAGFALDYEMFGEGDDAERRAWATDPDGRRWENYEANPAES